MIGREKISGGLHFLKTFYRLHKKNSLVFLAVIMMVLNGGLLFAEDGISVIKIENAQKTEYKKNEETGDDEIVLTGAVAISVTKGNTATSITASQIVFNRTTNMVYANGAVTLKQTGGSEGTQDISAETLLFNTETLEGIFDNGKAIQASSDAINLPSGSKIFVSSEIFGRDASETIVFKNATMTFCDEENPHWKIWASKIWLLPGGEFAFLNAVLYVGHVPVMYLPAFYYPKDELIFNPSFGYDVRKGYYFNSTTYLIGRKPLDTSSSGDGNEDMGEAIFNFMKPTSLKEQQREGLVLHNLGTDYTGDTSTYLKIMADYYTNLGGMVGIDGSAKPSEYITSVGGYLSLGFSRTLFYDNTTSSYLPYSSSGKMYNDSSDFMGLKLPFRYGGALNFVLSKPFSFRLSMPFYSDPFFNDDFGHRSEYMDWIGFMTSSSKKDDVSSSTISSFTWDGSASYNLTVPKVLKPYIDAVSISADSSLVFSSMSATSLSSSDNWRSYTPQRLFYYPSQITPFKFNGRISGTIFSYPPVAQESESTVKPDFEIPMEVPAEFRTDEDDSRNSGSQAERNSGKESSAGATVLNEADLPKLEYSLPSSIENLRGLEVNVGYSVNPQFTTQLNYNPVGLTCAEDFKWDRIQSSYYQIKVPATITGRLSYRGDFLSLNTSLNFDPQYQNHPNLDGYAAASAESIRKTDYDAFNMDLSENTSVSFKPFIYNSVFKNTSISWSNTAKLLRTRFLGDVNNPEWEYLGLDVTNDESVSAHSLSATVSAIEESNFSQTLTLTSNLPPQNEYYSATVNLVFPYVTASLSSGISGAKDERGEKTWTKELLRQSLTANLFAGTSNALTFTESFNFNWDTCTADSLKLSLSWRNLMLSFVMSTTYDYTFDQLTGWNVGSEKKFLVDNASLSYSYSGKSFEWMDSKIKLTPSFSTALVFDCIRPTNSYFRFAPALTFKVNNVLDLSFSSESKNSVIYRYVQGIANNGIEIPGETNLFVDLFNSFAFWSDDKFFDPDQAKRKSSGFKLKNLKVTATHDLHDWDLSASFSISPRLVTVSGRNQYNFDPYITLSVAWRPMSSLKAEVVDKYGEWELNP